MTLAITFETVFTLVNGGFEINSKSLSLDYLNGIFLPQTGPWARWRHIRSLSFSRRWISRNVLQGLVWRFHGVAAQ